LDAELSARVQNLVPDALGLVRSNVDLESVLSGIAGPRDPSGRARNYAIRKVIILDGRELDRRELLKRCKRARPLNRKLSAGLARVVALGVVFIGRRDVFVVLFLVGGIAAKEVMMARHLVDQDVVHEAAMLIQESRVLSLSDLELRDRVGGHRVCKR